MADKFLQLVSPPQVIFIKAQQNMEKNYTFKKEGSNENAIFNFT
jgi:hypothetical protein